MDYTSIIVALITAGLGLVGVMITNSHANQKMQAQNKETSDLFIYRIQQLEKKQDRYNNLQERMLNVENKIESIQNDIKEIKGKTK